MFIQHNLVCIPMHTKIRTHIHTHTHTRTYWYICIRVRQQRDQLLVGLMKSAPSCHPITDNLKTGKFGCVILFRCSYEGLLPKEFRERAISVEWRYRYTCVHVLCMQRKIDLKMMSVDIIYLLSYMESLYAINVYSNNTSRCSKQSASFCVGAQLMNSAR